MKRVLIIGMADSIHIARWIKQFENVDVELHFFPSAKFRKFTPEIRAHSKNNERLKIHSVLHQSSFSGYIDFALFELSKVIPKFNLRKKFLQKVISRNQFSIVHVIEIQHSGYLFLEALHQRSKDFKVILTNWGSDIYFFANQFEHARKIDDLLGRVDFYSAECARDYDLAQRMGFEGAFLPLIPNAGGFIIDERQQSRTSTRSMILIKGNGGTFGNVELVLPVISQILLKYNEILVHFYSVTSDVESEIVALQTEFPGRVQFSLAKKRVDHEEMLLLFRKSRIYVSSSKSDGISTSFLEALVSGAYPVQSDTSCAKEWIHLGFKGSVVANNAAQFKSTIENALDSDELVDLAQESNIGLAKIHLEQKVVSEKAREFYNLDFLNSLPANNAPMDHK